MGSGNECPMVPDTHSLSLYHNIYIKIHPSRMAYMLKMSGTGLWFILIYDFSKIKRGGVFAHPQNKTVSVMCMHTYAFRNVIKTGTSFLQEVDSVRRIVVLPVCLDCHETPERHCWNIPETDCVFKKAFCADFSFPSLILKGTNLDFQLYK